MGRTMRLLFVGNSLTFLNDLPGTIQRLAAAGGMDAVETESKLRRAGEYTGVADVVTEDIQGRRARALGFREALRTRTI
jgi:hypothetical protein